MTSLGVIFAGKSSWFGGPRDSTTGATTASGAPVTTPGIAVYNHSTLGGWWAMRAPNGNIGLVKQTDIGPAPSTGRTFDFTYSLLSLFGYSERNFPTGAQSRGVFVGHDLASAGPNLHAALTALGATAGQTASIIQSIDAGAIMQGKSAVVAPLGQKPGTTVTGAGQTPSGSEAVPAGVNVADPLASVADLIAKLTSSALWLRVLEAVGGVALLIMGLMTLSGRTTTPVSAAKRTAAAAGKAATVAA